MKLFVIRRLIVRSRLVASYTDPAHGLTHLKIHFLCDSLLYMPYKPISSLALATHFGTTQKYSRVRENTKITDGNNRWLALEELGSGLALDGPYITRL